MNENNVYIFFLIQHIFTNISVWFSGLSNRVHIAICRWAFYIGSYQYTSRERQRDRCSVILAITMAAQSA